MPKRSAKKKPGQPDVNEAAKRIVDQVTGMDQPEMPEELPPDGKNPAAVALGRLGGLKGGKARAEKLSAAKRKQIAKKAAAARWKSDRPKSAE